MKINLWFYPVAALLVTGGWVAFEHQTAVGLAREINRLSLQGDPAAMSQAGSSGSARELSVGDSINWLAYAHIDTFGQGRPLPDLRAWCRVQHLLLAMSAVELIAQLDQIADLKLTKVARKRLELLVLTVLEEKEPRLAVERAGADASEDYVRHSWHPENAFRRWAEQDPNAATAWLDQQLAAGKFPADDRRANSMNMVRKALESALIVALLPTNPAAASARLGALPGEGRALLFALRPSVRPEHDAAYVRFIRANASAVDVSDLLCDNAAGMMSAGGYSRVDRFIAAMGATSAEKYVIAVRVILSVTGGDASMEAMDAARAWAFNQLPAQADEVMGEALAKSAGMGSGYKAASALALKYHEHSGNDSVLASFLKHTHRDNANAARAMIDRIKDPSIRQHALDLPQFKKN